MTTRVLDPKGDTDLYCRLSREQENKVGSVELQERNLIKECKRLGLRARAVHVDDGVSAHKRGVTRPGYVALCAAIKARECENIIAVDMDRFSRQTGEWDALLYIAGEAGVRLFARGTEVDASSPAQRMVAMIMGVVADTESATKGAKIRDAHAEIAAQGKFHGGRRPYGYEGDGVGVYEPEAKLYRELVERAGRGVTLLTIATDWKARGVLAQNDTPFDVVRLRSLIFSPRHVGLKVHHRKVVGPAVWPGLVTVEEQARAIAMVKGRAVPRAARGDGAQATAPTSLLQGIVHCALCGTRMVINRRHNRVYYRCPSIGGGACGKVLVNGALADAEIEGQFIVRLTQPKVQRTIAKAQASDSNVAGFLARLDRVETKIVMLRDMLDGDEIEAVDYRAQMKTLTVERREARAELEAQRPVAGLTLSPEVLVEKWDDLTLDEKRANLIIFVPKVMVTKHLGTNRKVWNPARLEAVWADAVS